MLNFFDTVLDVLKQDNRFFSTEGVFLRNAVYEAAMRMDTDLIRLLLSDKITKKHFFTDVDGVVVFDKVEFGWVINNRQFLPDNYTRFKNKIGLSDEYGNLISATGNVLLAFPYKDCLLEMDSTNETEKRQEIFFNEMLMSNEIDRLLYPKVFVEARKYEIHYEKGLNGFEDEDNLIIKGNNLLTLYSLLPRYEGRIKMMYWDILYNTQSDIVPYNDSFKHSSWLVMMKNRLEVAKRLLDRDGVICLQCDDNEMAYLKVLCDEIFKRNNFIGSITVKMSTASGVKTSHRDKTIIKEKETILIYCSDGSRCKIKPQYMPTNEWDSEFQYFLCKNNSDNPIDWTVSALKDELLKNGLPSEVDINNRQIKEFIDANNTLIWRRAFIRNEFKAKSQAEPNKIFVNNSDGKTHYYYRGREMFFLSDKIHECFTEDGIFNTTSNLVGDIWLDINTGKLFSEGDAELRNGKKPEFLIARLIDMFTKSGDIVLDAYLGSGTTAAVAHKMGRHYIGVEQLDAHINIAVKRLLGVINGDKTGISKPIGWQGGGSFVYCELAQLNQKFVERIQNAATNNDLSVIWSEMQKTGFISNKVNPKDIDTAANDFQSLSMENRKRLLLELLDKNLLYVNLCDIDDEEFKISDNDKAFTRSFYREG